MDVHSPFRTISRDFALPPLKLKAGLHTLTMEYRGASPEVKGASKGIDFIWIQDAE